MAKKGKGILQTIDNYVNHAVINKYYSNFYDIFKELNKSGKYLKYEIPNLNDFYNTYRNISPYLNYMPSCVISIWNSMIHQKCMNYLPNNMQYIHIKGYRIFDINLCNKLPSGLKELIFNRFPSMYNMPPLLEKLCIERLDNDKYYNINCLLNIPKQKIKYLSIHYRLCDNIYNLSHNFTLRDFPSLIYLYIDTNVFHGSHDYNTIKNIDKSIITDNIFKKLYNKEKYYSENARYRILYKLI